MNLRMYIKLVALGTLIVLVGNWLRRHDLLTAIALVLLFVVVAAKIVFALIVRRGNEPPSNGNGGGWQPEVPVPKGPGGRPPALSAAAKMES